MKMQLFTEQDRDYDRDLRVAAQKNDCTTIRKLLTPPPAKVNINAADQKPMALT